LETGDPFTLSEGETTDRQLQVWATNVTIVGVTDTPAIGTAATLTPPTTGNGTGTMTVTSFSEIGVVGSLVSPDAVDNAITSAEGVVIDLETSLEELQATISDNRAGTGFNGFNFFNYDIRSLDPAQNSVHVYLLNDTSNTGIINDATGNWQTESVATTDNSIVIVVNGSAQGYVTLDDVLTKASLFDAVANTAANQAIGLLFYSGVDNPDSTDDLGGFNLDGSDAIIADFFSFGFTDDGVQASERISNQIIRIEAEESGDNTSTFNGSLEYVMMNQLNIIDESTFLGITPIANDPSFIVIEI
jgi:hypothetical protein